MEKRNNFIHVSSLPFNFFRNNSVQLEITAIGILI